MKCIDLNEVGAALWLVLCPESCLHLHVCLSSGTIFMSGPRASSVIMSAPVR